jgi:hypothetical protein
MGLLISTALAKNFVSYSSPADVIRDRIMPAAVSVMEQRCAGRRRQGPQATHTAAYFMMYGAYAGMYLGSLAAAGLFVTNPTTCHRWTLPGLRSLGLPSGVLHTLGAELVSFTVRDGLCMPLLNRAEHLKDTHRVTGSVVQVLALACRVAAVVFTEPPRLALAALQLSGTLVGSCAGAVAMLLCYGAASLWGAWGPNGGDDAPASATARPAEAPPVPEPLRDAGFAMGS